MSISITILADNQAVSPLQSEHGLSILIETGNERILFDAGQGGVLPFNADLRGIHLSAVDAVVLSHGHYDHTGGLPDVLSQAKESHVYFHPSVFIERYSLKLSGPPRPVHMPEHAQRTLENHPQGRNHPVSSPLEIFPNVFITGFIPRLTDYEDTGGRFYLDAEGKKRDLIEDDQALWLETQRGLVIITGCCHSGLENTVAYIREISGTQHVHTIIGGFHLLNADVRRITRTLEYLRFLEFDSLYPGHCTGAAAVAQLKRVFADRIGTCQAGLRINL